MLTGVLQHANKLKYLANAHSTTILTGVGVGGTVTTAYLTGRASFKASRIIDAELKKLNHSVEPEQDPVYMTRIDKTKIVWKEYLPPIAAGIVTITCIVVANKISSKKIAALAVAGGISERALQEYKDKVVEKLGARQDEKIRDEVAQDRVLRNPQSREIVVSNAGDVLCYDMTTDRYFHSSVEKIRKAEISCGFEILHFDSCSLSRFYEDVGLTPTTFSDTIGWNVNHKMEVDISTVLTDDGRPCLTIAFKKQPVSDYQNVWG
jgi:hypothetical protein